MNLLENKIYESNSCSICLEPYKLNTDNRCALLHCGHFFHRHCLSSWIQTSRNSSCPTCRAISPRKQFSVRQIPSQRELWSRTVAAGRTTVTNIAIVVALLFFSVFMHCLLVIHCTYLTHKIVFSPNTSHAPLRYKDFLASHVEGLTSRHVIYPFLAITLAVTLTMMASEYIACRYRGVEKKHTFSLLQISYRPRPHHLSQVTLLNGVQHTLLLKPPTD